MPDVAMIYLIKYRLRFGTNIDERCYEMARNNPWKLIGAIELSLKFNKDFIPAVLNDTIIPFLNGEGV